MCLALRFLLIRVVDITVQIFIMQSFGVSLLEQQNLWHSYVTSTSSIMMWLQGCCLLTIKPWDNRRDKGLTLVWTHWLWSLSVSSDPPPPPLSDPVQLPALGLACRSVHLYLLYVGGWSSSTVSGQPYLDHGRYGTAEASVSDDTLVKTHRPPVCVCVAVLTCTCGGLQNVFINVY